MRYLNVSTGSKTSKVELKDSEFVNFLNHKLFETISLEGVNYKITGGSTDDGTPMCKALIGSEFKKMWYKGKKQRKYGNTIGNNVKIINCKLIE